MRQLVFHGPGRLAVEEADPLPVGPDEVRVAVRAVGVCGSDVHGYTGVNSRRVPGMVMGHEAVGTVAEVGERGDALQPGVQVVINPIVSCGECELCRDGSENLCEARRIYGCIADLPGAYAESIVVKAANAVPFEGPAPLECVGHSATLASALNAVPPKGLVVFVGLAEERIELQTTPLMVGERRIVGS